MLHLTQINPVINTEGRECLWQVDDFELTEETPVKAPPKSRTPVTASPEAPEPQARRMKPPASAERRTADWLSALSPVAEHDELNTSQLDTQAADASPVSERSMDIPIDQLDTRVADASSVIEHDGHSPVSRLDSTVADASPNTTGTCWFDSNHTAC